MELLKRYKELKAQGVNISLMELKKQMEEGVNKNIDANETTSSIDARVNNVASTSSFAEGGSTLSSYSTPKSSSTPAFVSSFNPEPQTEQTPQYQNYQSQFKTSQPQIAAFMPSSTPFTAQPLPEPQVLATPAEEKYCGNVTSNIDMQEENSNQLKKYALIGYPLGHSLSKYIHNAGFKSLGLNATYEILETPPESLVDRIKFLKSNNFAGFNITIPLKLPITMFLDEVDASADIVNAVNTVVINPETKELKGYNTDVLGFRNAIPEDITLAGKSCGVLGTGGAARAAITALAQNQVKSIKLFTRNVPNCLELLNFLRERFPNIEFNAFQIERIRDLSDIEILVNTTPIGMQGRAADLTPVEENELRTLPVGAVVYDVIYNPKKTVLLKLAQKNGYRTINGVDMFIHQALAAEQIWTGRMPDFKDMKIAALENL